MKKHVEKVEEKQEEVPAVEEQKNDYVPVEEKEPEPIKYEHPSLEQIESERRQFNKSYRVQNTLKWVLSMLCIAVMAFACIGIPNIISDDLASLKTGLMVGITVGALIIFIGYSVLSKNLLNKRMKKYFSSYYNCINTYAFEQEGFDKVVLQEPGKIDIELFKDIGLYKDIISVGSRGLTEFEYHEIPMKIVECAGNIRDAKAIRPVFVGKLLHGSCSYLDSQMIAVYFKGNQKALPPTNIGELKVLVDNSKYAIYSNNTDYKKVLKPAILKMFDKIEMNDYLIDLAISMHDGKIFICFGYDDPLMILPLQNQFDPRPNEQFKKDLGQIIKVMEALH